MPEKLIMKCGANAQESHVYLVLEDGTQRELLRCRRVVIDTGDAQLQESPRATVEMWAYDFESTIEITPESAEAIIRVSDERSMPFLNSIEANRLIDLQLALSSSFFDGNLGVDTNLRTILLKIADVLKRREDIPF